MEEAGTYDKKEQKGEDGVVKRWLDEIKLADKRDKDWVADARNALKVYSGRSYKDQDHSKKKEVFNILWSNVETKRPALYNSSPRPDVRRRFRDESPIGKHVAEILERSLSFTIEENFEPEVIAAVNDMLLVGRAITRVKYVPTMGEASVDEFGQPVEPEVEYQEIDFDQVQWGDFQHGPAKRWKDVPWVKFNHLMVKEDVIERWGEELAELLTYNVTAHEDEKKDREEQDNKSIFKQVEIYEIWDKDKREVLFIAPCYKDKALEVMEDPLGLQNFYPMPPPMYAIENPTSIVPATEYGMYETLAQELESLTVRLGKIIDGMRLRGIYDSTLVEVEKLFDEQDNGFIPAEDVSRLIEGKGLDNAIWMLPIKEMAEVLQHLYKRRESVVQEIYQITGISDIMRGATNPHETLGAQEIKSNFGTQRLQRQQREVQRYIRDLIRIASELIAENFSSDMLSMMTGLKYPSAEEKAAMEQQENPMAAMPSWEEIMQVLQSDMLREFAVDVETDSTIQNEQAQDEERVTKLLTGLMNFMDGMAPAVQQGILPIEAAKQILKVSLRRFKFGRELEDAIDTIGQQPEQQEEDPAVAAEQQAQQMEMQVKQAEAQHAQQMQQVEAQTAQAEAQAKTQELQLQSQLKAAEHQQKMEALQLQRVVAQEKHQMEMQKLRETPKGE